MLGRPGHEAEAAFSDLNMLVLPGGQERTEQRVRRAVRRRRPRLTRVIDTGTRFSIIEADARQAAQRPLSG